MEHNLDKYWFYLDEVSKEFTQLKGPFTRANMQTLSNEKAVLRSESYIWHPCLGKKWVEFSKGQHFIFPPQTLTDSAIHEACRKKQALLRQKYPHLRGCMEMTFRGKTGRKWLIILPQRLAVLSDNKCSVPETEINLTDVNLSLAEVNNSLGIVISAESSEWVFTSRILKEVVEWFQALRCARYLLLSLGDDLVFPEIDSSELHVCNVRNSEDYMGDKIFEGLLRKEGSVWKVVRSRWFILRTHGLYYYLNKTDKVHRGMISIFHDSRVEALGEYKHSHHFEVVSKNKNLHLWADNVFQKEAWVKALNETIHKLKELNNKAKF